MYYYYCLVIHGSLSGGPPSAEFFGPDRPALPDTDYWQGMIRIWDGDDDPPIDDEELRARVDDHRQEWGESYPAPEEDP